MNLPEGYAIGEMNTEELATLEAWVAEEGWNPGLADLALARTLDPAAFIALRQQGVLAGAGTIFRHTPDFGFMGLFIMRPDLRRQGIGSALWQWRRDAMRRRLAPGGTVGMDGVFEMVPFYERGGFRYAHRSLRYQGVSAGGTAADDAVTVEAVPAAALAAFDHLHFPCARERFLHAWLDRPGVRGRVLYSGGVIRGWGALRPCCVGFKVGPLFAHTRADAERLLASLLEGTAGTQIQIDIPEPNVAGIALARSLGFSEVFGCARLYAGPSPRLPLDRIFGVTSFEFG